MKDLFQWNEKYSVGVQQFDADHRHLLEIAHDLVNGPLEEGVPVPGGNLLDELVTRAQEHFSHEERLLKLVEYPTLDEHHDQHQRLILEIQAYQKAITKGKLTGEEVARFIAVWLLSHIEEEDQKYRSILNENGYR